MRRRFGESVPPPEVRGTMALGRWVDLGRVPYGEALGIQERCHAARKAGEIPDTLLLLEHSPVITMGRTAKHENLLVDKTTLAASGVELYEAARGGDITYHGPGQLVGYPIFDLEAHRKDVHWYLRSVEEALIRALAEFGLEGGRVSGRTGVWVGEEKVAAIGVGVRRWVTWHGFALNVSTDLDAFSLIVPCGIRDKGVTSLCRVLGRDVSPAEVQNAVLRGFSEVFGLELTEVSTAEVFSRLAVSASVP
jgi:lipoate-protein ligase B